MAAAFWDCRILHEGFQAEPRLILLDVEQDGAE
jgi:hypothetical protein